MCYCIFSGSKSFLFHSSFVLLIHSSFWVFSVWDSRLRCPLCWAGCYWKAPPCWFKSMDLDIFRWNPWFHKSGYIGGLESQAWESGLHFRVVLDSKSKVSLEISNGYCPCCFGKKGKTTKSRRGPFVGEEGQAIKRAYLELDPLGWATLGSWSCLRWGSSKVQPGDAFHEDHDDEE